MSIIITSRGDSVTPFLSGTFVDSTSTIQPVVLSAAGQSGNPGAIFIVLKMIPPCFVTGTRILTPLGYTPVEQLSSGDKVLTADRRSVPIKLYSFTVNKASAEQAPYRIPAGSLGKKLPKKDLHLSSRHAIKDARGVWQIPKYLAFAVQYGIGKPVTYYHVECPNFYRDNLIAEGAEVESFKNKQGKPGVTYIWREQLRGWERLGAGVMTQVPKNPTTYMIYSF